MIKTLFTQLSTTSTSSRIVLVVAVTLLLFQINISHASKLYKWVDDDGNIRYSDQLPPDQVNKGHQQLNAGGIVVNSTEAAKSKEELEAERQAKREAEEEAAIKKAEQDRIKAIQEHRDRVLLLTFSSEEELEIVRENRIEVIDSVIRLITKSIASTQERLDSLQKSADDRYISLGKEVPGGLAQNIEESYRKIANREAQLEIKLEEKLRISTQYDQDLLRFRELMMIQNQ